MTAAIRRGAAPRRKVGGRQPVRGAKRPSIMDRAVAALPVSEATLHRIVAWAIMGVVVLAVAGAAVWAGVPGMVGTSAAEVVGRAGFRVEQIEVTGLKRMDEMSVYAVALDQRSRAMPLVDLGEVRAKLMRYGWIADAQVSRRLPDTLLVHIVERQPAAVWQNQGRLTLIDEGGVALEPVSLEAMPALPLVIGDGANRQEPAYQRLLGTAPALKPLVKAATWVGNRRWDLTFESGERLSLPEGEAAAAKALVRFAEIDGTQRLLGRGYLKFDMRDPARLVARLPSGTEHRSITDGPTIGATTTGGRGEGEGGSEGLPPPLAQGGRQG